MGPSKKKTKQKSKSSENREIQQYSAYNIIQKKRDKQKLTAKEIEWFVRGLLEGRTTEYQMTAWLMAVYLNGMDAEETAALTDTMLYSGEVLHFDRNDVIDKHSTGGVGDKTSFILAPIAAACGVHVPMIAGRGLGHTGGTVDKIESIPGFSTDLTLAQFTERVINDGIVLIGQTNTLAPADKKIYALRDVTATIESIPLITASIMSKKLAEGASGIAMDIKCGEGAFMKKLKDARLLANSLRDTASRFNRSMATFITDMSQPLGKAIGNSLEIIESIETLKGQGPQDLTDLSVELAAAMVVLAGKAKDLKTAKKKCLEVLHNGQALNVFRQLVEKQGGNAKVVDQYELLQVATDRTVVVAPQSGFIQSFVNTRLGIICVELGGGRAKASDKIDFSVGLLVHVKIGEKIKQGDALCTLVHHPEQKELADRLAKEIQNSVITIGKKKIRPPKLIIENKFSHPKKSGKK